MPRIVGVDIPNDKWIVTALTYIKGIGHHTAGLICEEAGLDPKTKARDLSDDQVSQLAGIIDKSYIIGGQLQRQVAQNIARLRDIQSYRGLRHRRGLPVRGQRTQTNARTRKGRKKTVAGRKGVKERK
jgi:small subunit ribosomal protein S13